MVGGTLWGQICNNFDIVEYSDGAVSVCNPENIKFLDEVFSEYSFNEVEIMKELNSFLKTCLDSADLAENIDPLDDNFLNKLGLGIFVYAIRMRNGVKEVIDLV